MSFYRFSSYKPVIFIVAALAAVPFIYSAMNKESADPSTPAAGCEETPMSACALPSNAEIRGDFKIQRTEQEWRAMLTPNQYHVMREHGTEPPFRNEYWNNKQAGIYVLAGTLIPLFSSEHKYDSGTGWPSFWQSIAPQNIAEAIDRSHGVVRTEVHCSLDGSHLGHVFEDGPSPTGRRYCINSAALDFIPVKELADKGLQDYWN
jgi:peptide-methionine (R)-S-oxide reductase